MIGGLVRRVRRMLCRALGWHVLVLERRGQEHVITCRVCGGTWDRFGGPWGGPNDVA